MLLLLEQRLLLQQLQQQLEMPLRLLLLQLLLHLHVLLLLLLLLQEYRRCQIFLIALAALETAEAQKETGGPQRGPLIQILKSEDYCNNGEQGQYTHKRIDIAESAKP